MLNLFYAYAIIWIVIIILYSLGWSNLCVSLDIRLVFFLFFSIIISLIVGKAYNKKIKFYKLTDNPHKTSKVTKILLVCYVLNMIYAKKIPLIEVIKGNSYNSYTGIPILHVVISAFAIFYSMYIAYIFCCFKEKKYFIEYLIVISYFVLLMQRQNIFICILFFINIMWASKKGKIKIKDNIKIILLLVFFALMLLYAFGIFGNLRYGATWKWNDSSMIERLGRMSSKFPKIIPKEYFWSYIYLVTPLMNLNANILIGNNDNLFNFVMEFVPEIIRNNIFYSYSKESVYLPVQSLTASTAYVRVYNYMGFLGMYCMLIVQILLCIAILNLTYKHRKEYFVVVCNALLYFLVFSFFTNTIVYSTTALILIYCFLCNFKFKIRR